MNRLAGVHPPLTNGEVHIWQASQDLPEPQVRRLAEIVSREERERADRFRRPFDRDRFLVRRGVLRLIVARYLDDRPEGVVFRRGSNGKPGLAEGSRLQELSFNASHSGRLALFAFTRGRRVGIDVEARRPVPEADAIADASFSPRELATLRNLPVELRLDCFLRIWTSKEAYLKATGHGLSRSLRDIEVVLSDDQRPRSILVTGKATESSWTLREVTPAPHFTGALVVEAADGPIGVGGTPITRLFRIGTAGDRLRIEETPTPPTAAHVRFQLPGRPRHLPDTFDGLSPATRA
jgi:4'-phosphopantetheinyl transferase